MEGQVSSQHPDQPFRWRMPWRVPQLSADPRSPFSFSFPQCREHRGNQAQSYMSTQSPLPQDTAATPAQAEGRYHQQDSADHISPPGAGLTSPSWAPRSCHLTRGAKPYDMNTAPCEVSNVMLRSPNYSERSRSFPPHVPALRSAKHWRHTACRSVLNTSPDKEKDVTNP